MRTVNSDLVEEYADKIRPLLPLARRAYGTQKEGSPTREASRQVNALLAEYCDKHHGNITHLSHALEPDISLAGLRRRLRLGRAQALGIELNATTGRGSRDPQRVQEWVTKIEAARDESTATYGQTVRDAYADGISLAAIAKAMKQSYFSVWTVASSAA